MLRYFATGSADALVSVWDAHELTCIKTFSRLEWPVSQYFQWFNNFILAVRP